MYQEKQSTIKQIRKIDAIHFLVTITVLYINTCQWFIGHFTVANKQIFEIVKSKMDHRQVFKYNKVYYL